MPKNCVKARIFPCKTSLPYRGTVRPNTRRRIRNVNQRIILADQKEPSWLALPRCLVLTTTLGRQRLNPATKLRRGADHLSDHFMFRNSRFKAILTFAVVDGLSRST